MIIPMSMELVIVIREHLIHNRDLVDMWQGVGSVAVRVAVLLASVEVILGLVREESADVVLPRFY